MAPKAKARKGKKKKAKHAGVSVLPTLVRAGASGLGKNQDQNCTPSGGGIQQSTIREYDSGHNREGAVVRSPSVKRVLNNVAFLEATDAKMLRKFITEEWEGTGKREVSFKSDFVGVYIRQLESSVSANQHPLIFICSCILYDESGHCAHC